MIMIADRIPLCILSLHMFVFKVDESIRERAQEMRARE